MQLMAIPGIPSIATGCDLAALLLDAARKGGMPLEAGDLLVIAQKIVSKAEGRLIALSTVTPSPRALDVARDVNKDPRLVELILREAGHIVALKENVLIVEHRLGFVMANAGIDQSNVGAEDCALLLPVDPDDSARRLRDRIAQLAGIKVAVVINDSFGRAWRKGTVGHAIGIAGLAPVRSYIGATDRDGRVMASTEVGTADELSAAASHVMGQGPEGTPAVIIRGAVYDESDAGIAPVLRPAREDLFRPRTVAANQP